MSEPSAADRERPFIEEWADRKLGKGNRPCGWPNFGSISVDEAVEMLAAVRREGAKAGMERAAQHCEARGFSVLGAEIRHMLSQDLSWLEEK